MRIVGGSLRGRPIAVPSGRSVRPTSDRAREAVFNILAHGMGVDLHGARVLDLFAGSGAYGLEALSRGAASVVLIDNAAPSLAVIQTNIEGLEVADRARVVRADAARLTNGADIPGPFDLVFLDPPYDEGLEAAALESLASAELLDERAVCVVETRSNHDFEAPMGYAVEDRRTYGQARISFLRRAGP